MAVRVRTPRRPVSVKPIVAKVFALEDAADGLRYLIEEHPLGRVVLKI